MNKAEAIKTLQEMAGGSDGRRLAKLAEAILVFLTKSDSKAKED